MPSLGAKAFVLLLKLIGRKRTDGSDDALKRAVAKARHKGPALPSKRLRRTVQVSMDMHEGHAVYTLRPRHGAASGQQIVYLHGGSFMFPITSYHWRFVQHLVEATGCMVTVPLYPLAPEHHGLTALEFVADVYLRMIGAANDRAVTVIGDSAGGNLGLALALLLRDRAQPLPSQLILISPFLDLTLSHPSIGETEARDPMLSRASLFAASRVYAAELPLDHPYLSPVHANVANLPAITVYAGTHDILFHDAQLFAQRAKEQGHDVTLVVGEAMIHDWPILPFAEGTSARSDIVNEISVNRPALNRTDQASVVQASVDQGSVKPPVL